MKLSVLIVLAASLFLHGCATKRTAGWDQDGAKTSLSTKEERSLLLKAKKHWAKRHKKEQLLAAIQTYEKLLSAKPGFYVGMVYLTRGYYLLADGHTDEMEQKLKHWESGISWGEKAMATNEAFKDAVSREEEPETVEQALKHLTKDQMGAIYWTAVNLGKWGKNQGIATILKYKGQIKAMVKKVESFDPDYFFSSPDRYWGAYFAVAPSFAGGDLDKSLERFQKGIKKNPGYLGTRVLFAELYATKKGDKELFKKQLNIVLKAKLKKTPYLPENILERRKAKKLLTKMEELF